MLPTLRFEPSEQESNSAEPSRVGLLLDAYSGSADLDGIVTAWVLAAPGSSASAGIGSAGATVTLGLRRFGEWELHLRFDADGPRYPEALCSSDRVLE